MNPDHYFLRFLGRGIARLLLVTFFAGVESRAEVAVSNVRSAQRAGTKLVDIDYDISGTVDPTTVSVRISSDDGVTFTVPATSLSGAFGAGITPGLDRRVTWNAGLDWNEKYSPNMRFEVTVADSPPVPSGFALIPAGSFQMGDQSNPLVGLGDELPAHSVYLSAFYMGKYEVTKEEWDGVREATHSKSCRCAARERATVPEVLLLG